MHEWRDGESAVETTHLRGKTTVPSDLDTLTLPTSSYRERERSTLLKERVLYGVRRVAIGGRHGVSPEFGKHNVVLINNDTANVDGISFNIAQEKWMWNCTQLAEFARIEMTNRSTAPQPILAGVYRKQVVLMKLAKMPKHTAAIENAVLHLWKA
ncbi:hypothetical protein KIN20_002640 [Parelaphostrongylus tenuis]|uniref:Uncharacterized protein n=1 Tax=Parelaphostrongylus tenuis TaxID=148309 RepID=A0AAD5LY20_PARTN|nr:hypothetical protein KIN20_002640 [Parelaphostrongylus tenuis]